MKYSLISIVTPSFNSAKYIEDCIESVLNQDYPNFEHIIIDGGSTDRTIDILRRYSHLKWISETDAGQSDAINKGFQMAQGDIIGWLNADEFYYRDIFKIVNYFFAVNDCDIAYGDIDILNSEKVIIRTKHEIEFDPKILFYYGCFISTASTFYRRRIFEENNYLDIKYHYTMDYEFFVRLVKHGYKFKHINQTLSAFLVTGENKSGDYIKRTYERYLVQQTYLFQNQLLNNICSFIYHIKHAFLKIITGKIDFRKK